MTVIEKKKALKKMIDKLPEKSLDEAFLMVQDLSSREKSREKILENLLETEKSLFEKLAQ